MPTFTTIREVIAAYPGRFRAHEAQGIDGVIQLELAGEGGGAYHLIIKDQQLTIEEGRHPDPTVVVTTTAEDWLRINNREVNPMAMLMQGRVTITGSLPMATQFVSLFR